MLEFCDCYLTARQIDKQILISTKEKKIQVRNLKWLLCGRSHQQIDKWIQNKNNVVEYLLQLDPFLIHAESICYELG